jgi:hypothetical protein
MPSARRNCTADSGGLSGPRGRLSGYGREATNANDPRFGLAEWHRSRICQPMRCIGLPVPPNRRGRIPSGNPRTSVKSVNLQVLLGRSGAGVEPTNAWVTRACRF